MRGEFVQIAKGYRQRATVKAAGRPWSVTATHVGIERDESAPLDLWHVHLVGAAETELLVESYGPPTLLRIAEALRDVFGELVPDLAFVSGESRNEEGHEAGIWEACP